MTLKDLAKLIADWPNSSPSWVEVGKWLSTQTDPTVSAVVCQLGLLHTPVPDFGLSLEDQAVLRWYSSAATAEVRCGRGTATVRIESAQGRTIQELEGWR